MNQANSVLAYWHIQSSFIEIMRAVHIPIQTCTVLYGASHTSDLNAVARLHFVHEIVVRVH